MIDGVAVKQMKRWCDDRGFFSEVIKEGEETFHEVKQTSYTETLPGVIKAFHWHKRQWDVWFVVSGMAQVVLYDQREDSSTQGETQVIVCGKDNPVLISIPPGVAHGYRVLGAQRVGLLYHTSEAYDPNNPDEERISFDDPKIGFDWSTKNR
jgi:dTDP-4-dehydrorhamnose 3,5-epimerase